LKSGFDSLTIFSVIVEAKIFMFLLYLDIVITAWGRGDI